MRYVKRTYTAISLSLLLSGDLPVILKASSLEEVFATEIHPLSEETQIDFRADYGKLYYVPHALPDHMCERLLALTRSYHLAYAGIDLLLTPEGRYIYLELNALGQFGWLEDRTGVPLYRRLATLLMEGENI